MEDDEKQRISFLAAVQRIVKARVCKYYKCQKVAKQKLFFCYAKFLLGGNLRALLTV